MGKRVCDIRPGEVYWLTDFKCSRSGSRCTINLAPFQCEVRDSNKFYTIGPLDWISKSSECEIAFYGLYETYEEAVDAYNRLVQNELDRITSLFEAAVKRIQKKFIKK